MMESMINAVNFLRNPHPLFQGGYLNLRNNEWQFQALRSWKCQYSEFSVSLVWCTTSSSTATILSMRSDVELFYLLISHMYVFFGEMFIQISDLIFNWVVYFLLSFMLKKKSLLLCEITFHSLDSAFNSGYF